MKTGNREHIKINVPRIKITRLVFVWACLIITQACQAVDWKAVSVKVAAKQWQQGAAMLDGINTKTLRPTEAAAYCYYMGVCAYHLSGRQQFGRALLADMLQHRMHRIGDSQARDLVKAYITGLLQNNEPQVVEEWYVASNSNSHSGYSGKGYFLAEARTEIKPLRVLQNVETLSHDRLLSILQLPEDQAISGLSTEMLFKGESAIRGIQTTNAYSLVLVGRGSSRPDSAQKKVLSAFSGDIDTALKFFQKEYGVTLPQQRMILFTVEDQEQLQAIARRLHGIEQSSINIGYSVPDEFTAVATGKYNEHRNTGTLYHELCHILFQNDYLAIPAWLDEGLASVYSVFEFKDGAMYGSTKQWRGEVLRRVGKWHPSPTELVRMTSDEFSDPQMPREGFQPAYFEGNLSPLIATQATNNATACYLLLYLQEKGKLSPLYKAFRDRDTQTIQGEFGSADVALLKQIAGENIDKDFEDWLTVTIGHGAW